MMTSEHSEVRSPSAQPLLQDFDLNSNSNNQKRNQSTASLRSLEDGESSDSGSEFEDLRRKGRPGFWRRLRMSMRRRRNGELQVVRSNPSLASEDTRKTQKRWRWGWSRRRTCMGVPIAIMVFFGFIHILNFLCGYVPLFFDDPVASSLDWKYPATASSEIASHRLDITRDVNPVPCHSHNDYWRRVPLYDALRWGCTGVEADVWLFDEELFVGHSTYALTTNKTFRSMYVDPLVKMLDYRNVETEFPTASPAKQGVFETLPSQTLVLLVDFKNDGRAIFPYVSQQLSALREKGYLTYFDGKRTIEGPITVVATGNAPFDMIVANETYRDIFFDAPLASLYTPDPSSTPSQPSSTSRLEARGGQGTVGTSPTSTFDSTNSYYASVKMSKALGFVWWGGLSSSQLELLRGQVRGAHAKGLKARYWSGPKWPIGLRNRVWETLVDEGVDYLNGDDLRGMVGMEWGRRGHWGSLVG